MIEVFCFLSQSRNRAIVARFRPRISFWNFGHNLTAFLYRSGILGDAGLFFFERTPIPDSTGAGGPGVETAACSGFWIPAFSTARVLTQTCGYLSIRARNA